jgi:hypothetical protein
MRKITFTLWNGESVGEFVDNVVRALDTLVVELVETGIAGTDAVVLVSTLTFALVELGHSSATVLVTEGVSIGPGFGLSKSFSFRSWRGNGLRKDGSKSGSNNSEFHIELTDQ